MNYNLEGLDKVRGLEGFEQLLEGNVGSLLATFGAIAVFFAIMFAILVVFLWVFSSIGIMNLAKKNNIQNAWLSFLPIGRSYIIGKLGFTIYDKENKNAEIFMKITFILGIAAFLLGDSTGDLSKLIKYALLFFESWSFYNMFKALKPKNTVVYTVFTVLTGTLLGGIFLYLIKPLDSNEITEDTKSKTKSETKKEEKESTKNKFCANCGTAIDKNVKFCPECGKKVS